MKDLKQLQDEFADYLRGNLRSAIREDIISDEKAHQDERLGFYHDAYRLRLIEVLSLDYPGVSGLLGEESFGTLALAYIRAFPSHYRSIRWFGLHLPEFLHESSAVRVRESWPYDEKLWEMACFEKAQNDVFDAAQTPLSSVDDLAKIDPQLWDGMRIELVPAMRRLDLNHNIPQIWLALQNVESAAKNYQPDWVRGEYPASWLMWRAELDPKWRALDVDEAWAIDRLQEGYSFGEVCEGLTEWLDAEHVPLRAVTLLKTLIVDKLVTKISP